MTELLSGYSQNTQELMFRLYAAEIPEGEGRQNHRAAHLAALDLLGAALAKDFDICHVELHRIGLGKPKLIHDFLHVNLTHCRGLAAAAVGRMPLGVDAEAPRTVKDVLMQKVCSQEEFAAIRASNDKSFTFSRFWTLKEAYAKYTGEGIALDFAELAFSIDRYENLVFSHPLAEKVQFAQTFFQRYVISLCLQKSDSPIEIRSEDAMCGRGIFLSASPFK